MRWWLIRLWFVTLVALPGCAWFETPPPPPRLEPTPVPTPTPERWIHVSKSQRRLTLYEGSEPVQVYSIVLGKEPRGAKLYQGDHRTPEGEYHISKKYVHPGWSRFMLLSYPTEQNWEIYRWAKRHGVLPLNQGKAPGIGGAVGIHGTYDDNVNRRGKDWTEGCISLETLDIIKLYDAVDVGTRVVIDH